MSLLVVTKSFAADPVEDFGQRYLEERLREQQQQRLENQAPAINLQPEQAVPEQDETSVICFDIQSINIEGNTLISIEDLDAIKAPYLNTCMSKETVNTLIYKLTVLYIDSGYITSRVYVPKQDLNDGELTLKVLEGFIEKFDINENEKKDSRKLRWAMPAKLDQPLFLPDLEQGLDQINKVVSGRGTLKLWPGEKPGGSRVQILNTPEDQVRGHLAFDNSGSESTGEDRIRFGIEQDNLFDVNDTWNLFYIGSLDTNALAFSTSVPFRRWGFYYSISYSEFLTLLTPITDLFGQSLTQSFNAEYMLHRDSNSQTRLSSTLTTRKSRRFIVDVPLTPQKQVPLRIAVAHTLKKPGQFWNFEVGYTRGLDVFGADEDLPGIAASVPKNQFDKIDWRISYSRSLGRSWSYRSSLLGQFTDDVLLSSEQIHIGDNSTVRGFRDTPMAGDKGLYWRNDFTWHFQNAETTNKFLLGLKPGLFVDYGEVKDNLQPGNRRLIGAGLNLNYNYRAWDLSLSWGHGLYAKPSVVLNGPDVLELEGNNEFFMNLSVKAF